MGYQTLTVNKAYTIMACNFQGVDGGELPINTAFPYVEGMTQGASSASGDNIQIMDDAGEYVMYYLSNGKKGLGNDETLKGKWVKDGVATTDTIASGKAFWYVSKGHVANPNAAAFNIQVAGQVMSQSAPSRELAAQYMIIGSPYPVDIPLNGGIVVTDATEGASSASGDNIQIMDDAGEYVMYYLSNGKKGLGNDETLKGKWVKDGVATTDKFPAGGAAWYVRKGSNPVKVQFINPIAQ